MATSDSILLVDIDGVISDCSHRLPLLKDKKYDEFYLAAVDDVPNEEAIRLVNVLREIGPHYADIYFVTGRPERIRSITLLWLKANYGKCNGLIMRKDNDWRKSEVIKPEMVRQFFANKNTPERKKTLFRKHVVVGDEELFGADKVIYIDDDPKNCVAMKKAFPFITTLTYDTARML